MTHTRAEAAVAVLTVLTTLAACGGATPTRVDNPAGPAPVNLPPGESSNRPQTATITITSRGVEPAEVTVTVGARVTFVNVDSRNHEMFGGLDHVDRDCLEVDVVGVLAPGQSRQTRVFEHARTCAFHDYLNLGNASFQGRITVHAHGQ